MSDSECDFEPALNMFTSYEEEVVEYEGRGGETVRQRLLGWKKGAETNICIWSNILPRVVASNGSRFRGLNVLELGAGCGVLGLLACRHAASVTITDGDKEEVALIAANCEHSQGCRPVAAFLEWGVAAAQAAVSHVGHRGTYDAILGSQVVYKPDCIGPLVETVDFFLSEDGEMWLYNDAVSTTTTYEACRELLDGSLRLHGLVWEDALDCCDLTVSASLREHFVNVPAAYFLRISRRLR